jgi:hypothetical protein
MILPDTSQMLANLKVSEALSGRIRPGQKVAVYSDAMPSVPVTGEVQSVSVLAASGGWRDPNRRDYTVRVALDADPALGLKPSMRCKAEILLDRVQDSLSVPIQAIFRQGSIAYVYVGNGGGFDQRQVRLGRSSELRVEILGGVTEGDRVLLREPAPEEVLAKLDFDALQQQQGPPAGRPEGETAANRGGQPNRRPDAGRPNRAADAAPSSPVSGQPATPGVTQTAADSAATPTEGTKPSVDKPAEATGR